MFGKRHIDKYAFLVPFPEYSPADELHGRLAEAAKEAEDLVAGLEIPDDMHYRRARRTTREALAADGVHARIETLVNQLLL